MSALEIPCRILPSRNIEDPLFGTLSFISMPNTAHLAYWSCEWLFPPTGNVITIALPGDYSGPFEESRQFYIDLAARFHRVLLIVKPKLSAAVRAWFDIDLPKDPFSMLNLAGFDLDNPRAFPLRWEISFSTKPHLKWRYITIPFEADIPQEAIVDN